MSNTMEDEMALEIRKTKNNNEMALLYTKIAGLKLLCSEIHICWDLRNFFLYSLK